MIRVNFQSFKATAFNMKLLGTTVTEVKREVLRQTGEVLLEEVRANISLRDHTLGDLARLDHPYAKRHGAISGSSLQHSGPLGDIQVHRQSGVLLNALEGVSKSTSYTVQINPQKAPHAAFVIYGTRHMFGRDIVWSTAYDDRVKRKMAAKFLDVLGRQLRTKAFTRFEGL